MLQAWLLTFVLGVVGARTGHWLIPVLCMSFLLVPVWRRVAAESTRFRRVRRALVVTACAAAGLWWGHAHGAPAACTTTRAARVVASNGVYPGGGPIIIEIDGLRYESYGRQDIRGAGSNRAKHEPRLFSTCFALFAMRVGGAPPESGSVFSQTAMRLRKTLTDNARILPYAMRAWLRSIVIGDKSGLATSVSDVFRKTGLYHLLVVSGQHVSLIAFLMSFILRLPLQAAYAARLIGACTWQRASASLTVASVGLAVVYAIATGMSAASQRAVVLFAVWQITKVFFGSLPVTRRLLIAAGIQAVLFPIGFLSEASLMSWTAYLLVIEMPQARGATLRAHARTAFVLQLKLLVVAGACFGQLPFLGLIANGLFVSLFTLMLGLGVTLLTWPTIPGAALIVEMQTNFVVLLTYFSRLCELYPWLSLPADALPVWLRMALGAGSAAILLNTCRSLSIRIYESNRRP